ncbi:BrnA antitoxin family protein [Paraburkholderia sp. GAS42]|uniref:BrnA antitoxin family protein n=1 Tax=Paraburkholderia sp. GAS42 TaxID=3035135 RepID=UPI003D2497FE
MPLDHYTYRVAWSPDDGEYAGLCAEFPSLSWLAQTPEEAMAGIRRVVAEAVADIRAHGETIPEPGHPATPQEEIALEYDVAVLEAFRATGEGWQARMNAALRVYLSEHPL